MSLRRIFAVLTVLATLLLSACGGDDDGGDDNTSGDSSSETDNSSEPDDSGDDSGDDSEEPADAIDICGEISAEDMGEVIGATMTLAEVPGGGCNYSQEDPRAVSVVFNQVTVADFTGGFEGVRTGVTSVVDGEVEDLEGIGDDAFVVVGPALGGTAPQGAGAVLLGDTVIQLTLLQGGDLPEDEVKQLTTDVLTLVGDEA